MSTSIETLEPQAVWRLFAEMSMVPRESKHEERICAHVRGVAEKMGFEVRQDAVGNLVVQVPATPGCENAPITVLQGHLDMVCEKNSDVQHDFDNEPIKLLLDKADCGEPIVRADGTTLGADNGIGVCLGLAAASSPNVSHGPLELLCTIDEEMGMTGAKRLEADFIQGRRLINLDSEEDDAVYIGCAGGSDVNLSWEYATSAPPDGCEVCKVTVSGLRGGHSGCDIHLNRGSAIKLLVQTLRAVQPGNLRVAAFNGGSKRNAIPREAWAIVAGPGGTASILKQAAQQVQAVAVCANQESKCQIQVDAAQASQVLSGDDTNRIMTALTALPHGVLAVVPDIPGSIQTSNSTSTVVCEGSSGKLRLTVGCLARSSSEADMQTTVDSIKAVGRLAASSVESGNDYPGWSPDPDSPTLATCRRVYQELFGADPKVLAIHAGLECGIIGKRVGQMDMVSFGPTITGAHSPDECVYVNSVAKTWRYLQAVLKALSAA